MTLLQPRTSLTDHYSQLSDSELQRLTVEMSSLTPEAVELLRAEMDRRSLTIPDVHDVRIPQAAPSTATLLEKRLWLKLRLVRFACGHWLIGAYASTVVVGTCIYGPRLVIEKFVPQWVWFTYAVLFIPFFPLQTLIALLCGLVLGRESGAFWKSRTAWLAWIIPGYFLVSSLAAYGSGSVLTEGRWRHFFLSSVIHSRLQQRDTTLPFLASAAYAIGHCLGSKRLYRCKTEASL
jgi:hypothetical protein